MSVAYEAKAGSALFQLALIRSTAMIISTRKSTHRISIDFNGLMFIMLIPRSIFHTGFQSGGRTRSEIQQ